MRVRTPRTRRSAAISRAMTRPQRTCSCVWARLRKNIRPHIPAAITTKEAPHPIQRRKVSAQGVSREPPVRPSNANRVIKAKANRNTPPASKVKRPKCVSARWSQSTKSDPGGSSARYWRFSGMRIICHPISDSSPGVGAADPGAECER